MDNPKKISLYELRATIRQQLEEASRQPAQVRPALNLNMAWLLGLLGFLSAGLLGLILVCCH